MSVPFEGSPLLGRKKNEHVIDVSLPRIDSELYFPFFRLDYPKERTWFQMIGFVLGVVILLPIRIFMFSVVCIYGYIFMKIIFCGLSSKKYSKLRGWRRKAYKQLPHGVRVLLWIIGFQRIEKKHVTLQQMMLFQRKSRKKELPAKSFIFEKTSVSDDRSCDIPHTIVSNHMSMVDVLLLLENFGPLSFLARGNLRKTVCWGEWMDYLQCQYLYPSSDKKQLIRDIVHRQQLHHIYGKTNQPRLVIFPEGTTTNGRYLVKYRAGAFHGGFPVEPVMIRHNFRRFSPSWETIPVPTYIVEMLAQFSHHAELIRFPTYYPNEEEKQDPQLFADNVRAYMKYGTNLISETKVELSDAERSDKLDYHNLIVQNKLRWDRPRWEAESEPSRMYTFSL